MSQAEHVKELSQRVEESLSCLELMKMEIMQLKQELDQCADDDSFSNEHFAAFDLGSDTSSFKGDASIMPGQMRELEVPFPKLDRGQRIATPLPSPSEPGVASAFIRAPLGRSMSTSTVASVSGSTMTAQAMAFAMPLPRKPLASLSRQTSDYDKQTKKAATPRYENITFFVRFLLML
jgi:hypothetical protein